MRCSYWRSVVCSSDLLLCANQRRCRWLFRRGPRDPARRTAEAPPPDRPDRLCPRPDPLGTRGRYEALIRFVIVTPAKAGGSNLQLSTFGQGRKLEIVARSAERRVGRECVSPCRIRGWPD